GQLRIGTGDDLPATPQSGGKTQTTSLALYPTGRSTARATPNDMKTVPPKGGTLTAVGAASPNPQHNPSLLEFLPAPR
ncbi:MAG: hypothetical protein QHJ82_14660, partial [Verrucomicrobiota bacterium]|nr:hypothetical protein [Verrucomicrobiota bacterium]